MKYSELKRWLKEQGCSFQDGKGSGKGSHITVCRGEYRTILPYHPSKEVPKGTLLAIKKQLGLK